MGDPWLKRGILCRAAADVLRRAQMLMRAAETCRVLPNAHATERSLQAGS